ncbi:hypothetical protein I6A84_28450 [Frankia sp. CNm7]|uniref:Uncharacterized protein n=1 Tax=Frankia nepalensis TaxID=1836974 RepID=A0A937RT32_9ACTN|nr:hypothetical protein [Frankia nepalensis]MBL7502775.1 hypothetical protein [Frankia nepalensis]MBL7516106.1 hypothetical protein [Frankia nepalensis]MBL7521905.1 hypothetical protein [Frankia nepalensis]MBL7632273.1 hypothetical protein [Frankia nepalensis]
MVGLTEPWTTAGGVAPLRMLRMLPLRAAVASAPRDSRPLPGLPSSAVVSVAWRLDGAGRVVGAMLPSGHPDGGPLGARVLAGEGIWLAKMWPVGQEVSPDGALVELAAEPVRLVVHAPGGDIAGTLDQPCRPPVDARGMSGLVRDLRRDSRQVRIRVADRVWWLRAAGVFGVRVSRGGRPVYTTRGMLGNFAPDADELDISVVLLTLASIPSSTYAPILGF